MDLNALFSARTGAELTGPDPKTIAKGREVYLRGKVESLTVLGPRRLTAHVQGSRPRDLYQTTVRLSEKGAHWRMASTCSCPVALNCKHGVAVLFTWLDTENNINESITKEQGLDIVGPVVRPDIAASWITPRVPVNASADPAARARVQARAQRERVLGWVRELSEVKLPRTELEADTSRLYYVMRCADRQTRLSTWRMRPTADGEFSVAEPYTGIRDQVFAPPPFWDSIDTQAATLLMREQGGVGGEFVLAGARSGELLQLLAGADRLFFSEPPRSTAERPLRLAEIRPATLEWQASPEAGDALRLAIVVPDSVAVYTEPPCWINEAAGTIGEASIELPSGLTAWLRNAPVVDQAVAPDIALALHSRLNERRDLQHKIPNLPTQDVREIRASLVPVLTLSDARPGKTVVNQGRAQPHNQRFLIATFAAEYDGHRVVPLESPTMRIDMASGPALLHTDALAEQAALDALGAEIRLLGLNVRDVNSGAQWGALLGGNTVLAREGLAIGTGALVLAVPADSLAGVRMRHELLPALANLGWQIEDKAANGPRLHRDGEFDLGIQAADDLTGGRRSARWFELQSGIKVGDQNIDLAPVLADVMAFGGFEPWQRARCPKGVLWLSLADGSHAAIDASRLEPLAVAVTHWLDAADAYGRPGEPLGMDGLSAARLAAELPSVRLPETLIGLQQSFMHFNGLETVKPPRSFQSTLRPYQQQGVNWLQFLARAGLGGILADDMGLGKTVQVLAHLSIEKHHNRLNGPVLVVAPTSLVFNWALEAKAHAPLLKVLVLTGSARKRLFGKIGDADLVLTSYALLPRDQELLAPIPWHSVIVDEAQAVKNPRTRAAQALHSLQAGHRIALTGTPLENHLGELWSIMRFAMPELLGTEDSFRKRYRLPIERHGASHEAADRMQSLTRRMRPFLLRRTKAEVMADLPPRTEIIQRIELPTDQRDLYESIRAMMDQRVREALAGAGLSRSHIVVLDALLKLRQACCDPALVQLAAARKVKGSAKLEALIELLATLQDEGRKALVFSQFTSMLDLIETAIDRDPRLQRMRRVRLDGSTKDREGAVGTFQSGRADLFLLSLKAGGVGLNLTAADTVIHYDPWWNPAAENQATDRAHRIGQDKPVFVYKLIAAQTVEERILELQKHKAELAKAVLSESLNAGGNPLSQGDLLALFEPL